MRPSEAEVLGAFRARGTDVQHTEDVTASLRARTTAPAVSAAALGALAAGLDTGAAGAQAEFRAASARLQIAARQLEQARRELARADSVLRPLRGQFRQQAPLDGRAERTASDLPVAAFAALAARLPAAGPQQPPRPPRPPRPPQPGVDTPSPEQLRDLIARHAPQAVNGQLGTKRTVWLLLGRGNEVVRALAERDDPRRGTPVPNTQSMRRTFPELGPDRPLHAGSVQWIEPRDTLQVIWAFVPNSAGARP